MQSRVLTFEASDKSRALSSNMFLCRGDCFAPLRKNSLPVSVVPIRIGFTFKRNWLEITISCHLSFQKI